MLMFQAEDLYIILGSIGLVLGVFAGYFILSFIHIFLFGDIIELSHISEKAYIFRCKMRGEPYVYVRKSK